jgi:hypothetical protein
MFSLKLIITCNETQPLLNGKVIISFFSYISKFNQNIFLNRSFKYLNWSSCRQLTLVVRQSSIRLLIFLFSFVNFHEYSWDVLLSRQKHTFNCSNTVKKALKRQSYVLAWSPGVDFTNVFARVFLYKCLFSSYILVTHKKCARKCWWNRPLMAGLPSQTQPLWNNLFWCDLPHLADFIIFIVFLSPSYPSFTSSF